MLKLVASIKTNQFKENLMFMNFAKNPFELEEIYMKSVKTYREKMTIYSRRESNFKKILSLLFG